MDYELMLKTYSNCTKYECISHCESNVMYFMLGLYLLLSFIMIVTASTHSMMTIHKAKSKLEDFAVKTSSWDEECCICLEEMRQMSVCELSCRHKVHVECMKKWLESSFTCPLCRTPVFDAQSCVLVHRSSFHLDLL